MSAETIKIESNYLSGTIRAELDSDSDDFDHDAELLLKFHGIYQQDDRDVRRARTQLRLPLDYSCMVRASVPGGVITNDQWLALDRVAALADQKLRLTTRQGVQYHVVHKGELRELVAGINSSLLTTLGACGDVVRNVMACPLPHPERRAVIEPLVAEMVARFRPRTESYWELWVDGERAVSAEPRPDVLDAIDDVEPIYGAAYLPRKFKIAIAWPGDNCVDIYTNDVGIVPTLSEGTTGDLTGYVVLAGGGMGMAHNRPDDTYPLLAQPVGWVPPGRIGDVVEAIVTTQRDHGNREDRSRARLKYLLEERGIDWLRGQIEDRTGRPLAPPIELPAWEVGAHHGWHDIAGHTVRFGPNTRALGLPVPSGKVAGGLRLALRRLIADGAVRGLRVTPRQDLLLLGVTDVAAVENVLRANGVRLADDQSPTRNLAIACPALPTCSKALGEAERVLPEVVDRLEKVLADTGNTGLPLRLNMTGCPNGCSRPYAAELGIVGRTKKNYDIFVGGSPAGDRLARLLRADVPLTDVPELLRPLLEAFARSDSSASFGDWCVGQDWSSLEAMLPGPTGRRRARP
ncbi:MAG: NADPH-dependent assimilatory sulfite reductase hemoprotein subunit [Acidimicrobiales bacterium]|nr:MAG: NADPH-dependent assimilatory sulfite reductase hemoprotein subunit [Acidimicrobiales bacterium]